jgi:hypothetical protein
MLENHCSGAYDCALAYLYPRKNGGVQPDMAVGANPHAPAERDAGRKVGMVGNATVVFDDCTAVDNAICPDHAVCIDHRIGHDDRSRAD